MTKHYAKEITRVRLVLVKQRTLDGRNQYYISEYMPACKMWQQGVSRNYHAARAAMAVRRRELMAELMGVSL